MSQPPRLISEPIKALAATADTAAMAVGGPGLPTQFLWRKETLTITTLVRAWRETAPCTHGSNETYARKHWFEVETTTHGKAKIYFERQPRSRNQTQRWFLYSLG